MSENLNPLTYAAAGGPETRNDWLFYSEGLAGTRSSVFSVVKIKPHRASGGIRTRTQEIHELTVMVVPSSFTEVRFFKIEAVLLPTITLEISVL